MSDDKRSIAHIFRPLAIATSASLCLMAIVGCGGQSDTRGERVGVEGTVVLDGIPMQNARIMFIGDGGNGQIKAIGTVADGCFVINTSHGPLAGLNRVELHPEMMELEHLEAVRQGDTRKKVDLKLAQIPAKFNAKSDLMADVKPDRSLNKFDFELTSK